MCFSHLHMGMGCREGDGQEALFETGMVAAMCDVGEAHLILWATG